MDFMKQVNDQPVMSVKLARADMTVADSPHCFSISCRLTPEQIKRAKSSNGVVLTLPEICTNHQRSFSLIHDFVTSQNELCGDDDDDDDDNVMKTTDSDRRGMLLSLCMYDINCSDNTGAVDLAASYATPRVDGFTLDTDVLTPDKKHRVWIPYEKPAHYIDGMAYTICHPLKHSMTEREYNLLERNSTFNPRMVFGDGVIEGSGGALPECDEKINKLARNGNIMLHADAITNPNVCPSKQMGPGITEMMNADAVHGTRSTYLVSLPSGYYPSTWFARDEDKAYRHEKGVLVPIEEYAHRAFHCCDCINQARIVTLNSLQIHFKVTDIRQIPEIYFKLRLNILWIVPSYESGRSAVPFQNYIRHLRKTIPSVPKPFSQTQKDWHFSAKLKEPDDESDLDDVMSIASSRSRGGLAGYSSIMTHP